MKNKKLTELQALLSLAALAQELRLRAFRTLVVAGPQGLTAGALAEALDISPSVLSFHLKELAHAGLVSSEPSGRYLIYRADFPSMQGLLDYLTEHCCQGGACDVRPARGKKAACAAC